MTRRDAGPTAELTATAARTRLHRIETWDRRPAASRRAHSLGRGLVALLSTSIIACAPSATPLIAGAGLHLDSAAKDGSGFAYRDLAHDVFFARVDGASTKIASDTASSKFAGDLLTVWFGLDAATNTIASMSVRETSGAVNAIGTKVATSSIDAPPDGAHLSFESVADAAAGTTDVHLDGTVVVAGAAKTKSHWSKTGDVFVLGSKSSDAAGNTTKSVLAFVRGDATSPVSLCGPSQCAREVAVTSDGSRVLYFDNDNNNAGDLEITTLNTGVTTKLAGAVSDSRIFVDESAASGVNDVNDGVVYFLGEDATKHAPDGSIYAISLASQGNDARAVLPPGGGALDVVDASHGFVVYATTAQDATTSTTTLRIVNRDGSGDAALGSAALPEGFSGDGRFYVFRDGVRNDGSGHLIGRLRVFDTSTGAVTTLNEAVRKAQLAGAHDVAWLDDTQHLRTAALGATPVLVQISVDTFDVMGTKLVYSIPAETNAGVWVLDLD